MTYGQDRRISGSTDGWQLSPVSMRYLEYHRRSDS